mmetsp:Transcript_56626/g.115928  ORF Transcript_56626/g.115928 Transcript_56626/m.115928 type:complete len:553 (-) Transcript_56626:8-1666(-)
MLADDEPDPVRAAKMRNAVISKQWFKSAKSRYGDEIGLKKELVKTKGLSIRRAAANQKSLTETMFQRITDMYANHFARGILKTREPEAEQIWNGDEVGFYPIGQWNSTLCFRWDSPGYTITPNERAPFWASVFFWTRADGVVGMVPPTVIHQGESGVVCYSNVTVGECDDSGNLQSLPGSWLVHQSPSGYNDREGFMRIARHFVAHCGPRRPQYIFVDGHDSHWCPYALQFLLINLVFIFFLLSQNSQNDQLNDNGPNAVLKAKYKCALEKFYWRLTCSVKLHASYFNSIFLDVWSQFLPVAGACTVRAFAKCGLFPLNRKLAIKQQEQEQKYGEWFVDERDKENALSRVAALGGEVEVQMKKSSGGQRETVSFAAVNHPKEVVMRKAVYDVLSSRFKQAHELCTELDANAAAKRIKIVHTPGESSAPPNTIAGLFVTQDVIEQARAAQQVREQRAIEAAANKEKREAECVERRAKWADCWQQVVAAGAGNVGSLTVKILDGAMKHVGLKVVGKKPEKVSALEERLAKGDSAQVAVGVVNLSDDSSSESDGA